MERQEFCNRLSALRLQKGVSARDMSLSLGQSNSYINNIENGLNLPSMTMFFCICDYLDISPAEFFDLENLNPSIIDELSALAKKLNPVQLEVMISLARELAKSNDSNRPR